MISEKLQKAIIGYYSNQITKEQADELIAWIEKSEENRKYFNSIGEVWKLTGSLYEEDFNVDSALVNVRERIRENDFRKIPGRMMHIRLSRLYMIAVVIVFLVALGVLSYLYFKPAQPAFDEGGLFEALAPKGSRSYIIMPDGTSIWLNADTRLKYSAEFGNSTRDVFLDGEAYFKVEKNAELPFRVITSDISITALGTSFNVKSYNDESVIETTLEEGLLEIESLRPLDDPGNAELFTLKPNQSAVFIKKSASADDINANIVINNSVSKQRENETEKSQNIEILDPVQIREVTDTKLYTSWKDSRWIIKNEKLNELSPKLERRFDVRFIFMNTDLEDYAITTTLLDEPLEQVLNAISLTTPIKFEVKSRNVYLYENPELIQQYERLLDP